MNYAHRLLWNIVVRQLISFIGLPMPCCFCRMCSAALAISPKAGVAFGIGWHATIGTVAAFILFAALAWAQLLATNFCHFAARRCGRTTHDIAVSSGGALSETAQGRPTAQPNRAIPWS
jgi:hypothetical protein